MPKVRATKTTPLFPEEGKKIILKQGQTGDCYLLSALDCMLNVDPFARKHIKSMFVKQGQDLEVRLPKSKFSNNLNLQKIKKEKFTYHKDEFTGEDVFRLSQKRQQEIDLDTTGAQTNSLAVKIFEHLIPYYFSNSWNHDGDAKSILAHNIRETDVQSSQFVAELLGLQHTTLRTFEEVVSLKTQFPQKAIYISMDYQLTDGFGKEHGRHAFSLQEIRKNSEKPGDYDFILVNPWNNESTETIKLNSKTFMQKKCSCASLSAPPSLLQASVKPSDKKKQVLNSRDLRPLVVEFKKKYPGKKFPTPVADPIIFGSAIEEAIKGKLKQGNKSKDVLSEEIECGIAKFFNGGSIDCITRMAGLRDFFETGVFNKDTIREKIKKTIDDINNSIESHNPNFNDFFTNESIDNYIKELEKKLDKITQPHPSGFFLLAEKQQKIIQEKLESKKNEIRFGAKIRKKEIEISGLIKEINAIQFHPGDLVKKIDPPDVQKSVLAINFYVSKIISQINEKIEKSKNTCVSQNIPQTLHEAVVAKKLAIRKQANCSIAILIGLEKNLKDLSSKISEMPNDENFLPRQEANSLLRILNEKKELFQEGILSPQAFKAECIRTINNSSEKINFGTSSFTEALHIFMKALLAIITLGTSYYLFGVGFFSPQTTMNRKNQAAIQTLRDAIEVIPDDKKSSSNEFIEGKTALLESPGKS